jgi:adenylate cyclase class 2
MKSIEVEQKFKLPNADLLRAKLSELGGRPRAKVRQVDVYYNAPHKDFLGATVITDWLRLRSEAGQASITFKHWYERHCDEFETPVADGEALRHILQALDFKELITVDKQREEWPLSKVLVAIDEVEGLGLYVEFEYKGEADSVDAADAELTTFITELGVELGEADRRGYPYQLLGRAK